MKHTPGPWLIKQTNVETDSKRVCEINAGDTRICIFDSPTVCWKSIKGMTVPYYPDAEILQERHEANSKLIAAAPDLLYAAKLALELFPKELGNSMLEEAIKKAEGVQGPKKEIPEDVLENMVMAQAEGRVRR